MKVPRPLPDTQDPRTAPLWAGMREHRVRMQRCEECGYVRWPAAPRCPECLLVGGSWTDIRPAGTVWSHATYHRAFHPAFSDEVPYAVVAVNLDDGPFLIARWNGREPQPTIGARVRARFEEVAEDVTLLAFEEDES
jgi:uncharacterized protein